MVQCFICVNFSIRIESYPYWNLNFNILAFGNIFKNIESYPYWNLNKTPESAVLPDVLIESYPYWNLNIFSNVSESVRTQYWILSILEFKFVSYRRAAFSIKDWILSILEFKFFWLNHSLFLLCDWILSILEFKCIMPETTCTL